MPSSSRSPTRWLFAVHRWVGLFVGANVGVLALTGLLLTFHRELDGLFGDGLPHPSAPGPSAARPLADLVAAAAREGAPRRPGTVSWSEEHPGLVFVRLEGAGEEGLTLAVDAVTAEPTSLAGSERALTSVLLRIHASLFAGTFGEIYVGLVGLALAVVSVTGFLVYGPFSKKWGFGVLRRGSGRYVLADLHRALGAATFVWNFVLATTGVLLTLGTLLLQLYAYTELRRLTADPAEAPGAAVASEMLPADRALAGLTKAAPDRRPVSLSLPGSDFAGPHHYLALLQGTQPLERHLLTLGVVNAFSGAARVVELPWYLKAVLLAQPLHFGDYGGLPLKVLWAAFSAVTMTLSGSGIYLFFVRRPRRRRGPVPLPSAEGATS